MQIQKLKKPVIPSITIARFIDMIGSKDKTSEEYAINILARLYSLNLLEKKQKASFFNAIWHRCNISIDEFSFSILLDELPHEKHDILKKFRELVANSKFPILRERSETAIELHGIQDFQFCDMLINSKKCVKKQDALSLLKRLLEWWDKDKEYLDKELQVSE